MASLSTNHTAPPAGRSVYVAPLSLITRAGREVISAQAAKFDTPLISTLLDSVSNIVLVLNEYRQIVFANARLLELLELESVAPILGMRPGELFRCEYAKEANHGCGTSEECNQCGALKVILNGLDDVRSMEECRLTRRDAQDVEAYDLHVCGAPFSHLDEKFVVFSISDISHEKRRRALERIFFHDILNTVGSLKNVVELMCDGAPPQFQEEAGLVQQFFQGMVEEIQAQKLLLDAESNDLQPQMQYLQSRELLLAVISSLRSHEVSRGRIMEMAPETVACTFESDITLLRRVLTNMVKNALEAEGPGALIRMGAIRNTSETMAAVDTVAAGKQLQEPPPGSITFWVHNPSPIPKEVSLQIFQRSFTTKGAGRGLGTYSIKLLAERYLGGSVHFASTPEEGTTFYVTLPLGTPCPF